MSRKRTVDSQETSISINAMPRTRAFGPSRYLPRKTKRIRSASQLAFRPGRLGSSRSAIPLQIAIHTFDCTSMGCFTMFSGTGFGYATSTAGVNASVQFVARQDQIMFSIGNGAFTQLGGGFSLASNYRTVFDQFRLTHLQLDFYYTANCGSSTNPNTGLPVIYAVVDYDDANQLTTAAQALSYSSCQVIQLGNSSGSNNGRQTIHCNRPAVQTSVETTGLTTNVAKLDHSPWLDSDYVDTEHNGVKIYFDPVPYLPSHGTDYVGSLMVIGRCRFQYKNVK